MFRGFEEDPFFRGHFEGMQSMHRTMMGSFGGDLFGGDLFRSPFMNQAPAIGYHDREGQRQVSRRADPFFGDMFGMGSMMSRMNGMMADMQNMHRQMETAQANPNGHFYTQSSVMSYSNVGDGPPKIYQATTSTRQAPGGVKETRKAVRDSTKGVEKMAIGHHINERGHVIERNRNVHTGEQEENQNLYNLDDEEKHAFDQEFTRKMGAYAHPHTHRHAVGGLNRQHQRALPSSGSRYGRSHPYDTNHRAIRSSTATRPDSK